MPKDRRHTAIMFTDIVGYTSLMGSDESNAFEVLRKNREIHSKSIAQFNGNLIKEMGDGTLISFNLASDAVRCAIQIQKKCNNQEIPLKIGIHQGEMVFEDHDVLGDGVNIASRIQDSSQAGSIQISRSVYQDIKNQKDIQTSCLGEKSFKNVDDAMIIYEILNEKITTPNKKSVVVGTQSRRKSIIVLPFVNMSNDPEQEYFSDGLTEEIITDLSQIGELLVISRNSAMTFKGTDRKTTEIANEVHVQYVLEGSVRKVDNNLRISAQLIDAQNDAHLWAQKYSGTLDDVFDIQEQVSMSIAKSLRLKLGQIVEEKILTKSINDPYVYELYLRARYEDWQFNEVSLDRAKGFLLEGLRLGGENALLYAELSHNYVQHVNNLLKDPGLYPELLKMSRQYAEKAIMINSNLAAAHYARGMALFQNCHPAEAMSSFTKGLELQPNTTEHMLYLALGFMYAASGIDMNKSYELFEQVRTVDPVTPISRTVQGWRSLFAGEFHKMVDEIREWQESMEQISSPTSIFFVWMHGLNRDYEEAYRIADWIMDRHPEHIMASLSRFMKYSWQLDEKAAIDSATDKLRNAAWWDDAYALMMAEGYAVLGEYDQSFRFLNRAIDYGITNISFLTKHDHFLENLRTDERFEKCLIRAKNVRKSMKEGLTYI